MKNDNLLEQAKWLKDNDQDFLHRVNCICDIEEERLKRCARCIKYLEANIASYTKAAGPSRRSSKELDLIKDLREVILSCFIS